MLDSPGEGLQFPGQNSRDGVGANLAEEQNI